jgi:hypothetical protein
LIGIREYRPSIPPLEEIHQSIKVKGQVGAGLALGFKVAVDQLLGSFPVVVPNALCFEGVNILRGGSIGPLGKVFDGIGQGSSVGAPDISNHTVNVKDRDRPPIHRVR